MRVLVTGATGFLGSALVALLRSHEHEVSALTRGGSGPLIGHPDVCATHWDTAGPAPAGALKRVDAVVHLAGEPVNGRWTRRKRTAIHDSRVTGTRNLVHGIAAAEPRPRTLVCATAIGYYGDRGETLLGEDAPSGNGFLAEVCRGWESAAGSARALGLSVAQTRFGLVLGRGGGALPPLVTATRLGAGGPLGSGRQWWSWIHVADAVAAIAHVLESGHDGAVNIVAPEPVRQRDLAHALGRALHRPAVLPAPSFALRAVLGGFSTELLSSRRVAGDRLVGTGFSHRFGDLDDALADLRG